MGIPILYFPFEDSAERFISNVGATNGKYDMFTARRNHVPSDFIPNHENVMERLKGFPLYVEDMPDTAEGICGTIARYKRKYGIKGVVIDGLKDVIPTIGENPDIEGGAYKLNAGTGLQEARCCGYICITFDRPRRRPMDFQT